MRFFFALLVLSTPALALNRHRIADPPANQGAQIDPETGTVAATPAQLQAPPTYIEAHSTRVANDLMLFQPTLMGITAPSRRVELFAPAPARAKPLFFVPAKATDGLEVARDRDRLLLWRGEEPQGGAVALGLAMFAAMTVLSAHAPRPLRILFDGPVHLGPAIFDGGGMGAGIAGRGL